MMFDRTREEDTMCDECEAVAYEERLDYGLIMEQIPDGWSDSDFQLQLDSEVQRIAKIISQRTRKKKTIREIRRDGITTLSYTYYFEFIRIPSTDYAVGVDEKIYVYSRLKTGDNAIVMPGDMSIPSWEAFLEKLRIIGVPS
ncbi:hypothetical protein HY312_01845 [Candidatus Saccharibacteria bacterium]|nr:hypothetical protein [Candidatus Saccharibacteria bacterium]